MQLAYKKVNLDEYDQNTILQTKVGMTVQGLFIANLKGYRKSRQISQLKLAEQCGSSQTYIAEIESGKKFPSIDMIERLASVLNIESYYLFQNIPIETGNQALSPKQKQEMAEKIQLALVKIINQY